MGACEVLPLLRGGATCAEGASSGGCAATPASPAPSAYRNSSTTGRANTRGHAKAIAGTRDKTSNARTIEAPGRAAKNARLSRLFWLPPLGLDGVDFVLLL